jgi:hypothetical protein
MDSWPCRVAGSEVAGFLAAVRSAGRELKESRIQEECRYGDEAGFPAASENTGGFCKPLMGGRARWLGACEGAAGIPDAVSVRCFFHAGNSSGWTGGGLEEGGGCEGGKDETADDPWPKGLGDLGSGGWLRRGLSSSARI